MAIEEEVFGLEVTVDDATRVKVLEHEDELAGVELGGGGTEVTCLAQVREQLTTRHKLKKKVNEGVIAGCCFSGGGVSDEGGVLWSMVVV